MADRGRLPPTPTPVANRRPGGHVVHRLAGVLERRVPRGAGWASACMLMLASVSYGVVLGDHSEALRAEIAEIRDEAANAAGFHIEAIDLTGQKQLSSDEVLAIAGVTDRASLLFFDADGARARLKANPWVADATVFKLFPDRLHIAITERSGFALWQSQGQLRVIARDGVVVEPFLAQTVTRLPLVVGKDANVQAFDFLAMMERHPQLQQQVAAYVLVAERRWNLNLKNGITIRLPEANPEQAIETVIALDRDKQLLSRDILAVDLRNDDRIAVRLSDEAAAARAEAIKAKTPKRKGSDA